MDSTNGKFKENLEISKDIIQIVGFVIAGIWAIFTFLIKDTPNLYSPLKTESELKVDSIDSTNVMATFTVSVENVGKKTFTIDTTLIEYLVIPIDSMSKNKYFDFNQYMKTKNADYAIFGPMFNTKYSVGDMVQEQFRFFLKKDELKSIIFQAEFFFKEGFNSKRSSVYINSFKLRCVPDSDKK
jgi:hypothetical protein